MNSYQINNVCERWIRILKLNRLESFLMPILAISASRVDWGVEKILEISIDKTCAFYIQWAVTYKGTFVKSYNLLIKPFSVVRNDVCTHRISSVHLNLTNWELV